nr:ABC transporter ATP-binding protein [uncultured Butyrivibrio sp.]
MRLENVRAGYGSKIVINNASIDIRKNEIISLIGPNGGGKSTLLKSISGQLHLLGGDVYIGEDSIKTISLKELARKMSIVTTERVNPEQMSAFDIVLSGRLPFTDGFGSFDKADKEAAKRAINLMKIQEIADRQFEALSDGQKQRTLIARAICQNPEFLIMDEPTSYLDIRYRLELMQVLKELAENGVTIIMSLHELELALQISDRVLMIKNDGNVEIANPDEVIESGVVQELYGLTDDMYKRVLEQLRLCRQFR